MDANGCPKENFGSLEILGCIGGGYYEHFFKAQHEELGFFAIKVQDKFKTVSRSLVDSVIRDKKLTHGIKSPFIARTLSTFQDDHNLYMVMELATYGDLEKLSTAIVNFESEELVRFIAAQLVLGLEYLHACHFIHNDLRTPNIILYGDGCLELCDLGLAKS